MAWGGVTETVFLSHGNRIDLILKKKESSETVYTAVNLASVTKMTLTFAGDTKITVTSTNQATDPILWCGNGFATGEVRMSLGGQAIPPGDYQGVPLVVYDNSYTDGIVWGFLDIPVVDEVEGVTTP
jgi:hypothetical protein